MNHLSALLLGLLLLWSGPAQGVSSLCCCLEEIKVLIESTDGRCEPHHKDFSCGKGPQCSHTANKECLFWGWAEKTKLLGLVSSETALSENVFLTKTSTPLDFRKDTQPVSTTYHKVNSNHMKIIEVLLPACHFLS